MGSSCWSPIYYERGQVDLAYSKRALFSIIIPVYNAQSTIIRLLTSIKKQKFDDYEVVMVIDGATDNSERVIKEFIIQNNLMNTWSCYTQNNSGVSAARNYGMSIAKGRYILFCDADDVVDLDLMNCISQKIADDAEKDDIIFFGKTNIKNGNIDSIDTISETKTVKIGAEYFEKLLKNNLLPTTWNKAIRRSFVGKTIFKDIPAGEDYEFYA
ncbi:glycosyltransferase family 2 protein [Levilactobacillus parabrevis]|nr:glycosyltransferase family 2 protein [Levilactobacillus parabrevis]